MHGEFFCGNLSSSVAVVTLGSSLKIPLDKVAIYGEMKTENLGIERVIANVISNPKVRFLIVCGKEIRGHYAGNSLVSLHKFGVDERNRIVNAKGAIPYIENISKEAIERFRAQVELIDMIGNEEIEKIVSKIDECLKMNKGEFGLPFIAIEVKKERKKIGGGEVYFHDSISVDSYCFVRCRNVQF
ncbi:MAG: tetrahydromethanopterin S-methyltransferase subunit A [Candidatus Thermoplasmatota archaeon]